MAGHKKHDLIKVKTTQGPMYVYDWKKYKNFAGYCTGQDDVSRTLINQGYWEPVESAEIRKLLEKGDRSKLFLDFGANVGWYSIMAANLGYKVIAYEGDPENCKTILKNAQLNEVHIDVHPIWLDEQTKALQFMNDVFMMKADLEGSERHAVEACRLLFEQKRIAYAYLEISPVFNNSYPALLDRLAKWGYKAYDKGKPFAGKFNFQQANFLFKVDK